MGLHNWRTITLNLWYNSKPMYKYLAIIACLIFVNNVIAQDIFKMVQDKDSIKDTKTYLVRSIDGKKNIIHILPNYSNHILRISCLKDTISLYDFWGETPTINVLNKTFLEIKYEVRGGSGLALGNVLILCVDKEKLHESIHVLRYSRGYGAGIETDYNIKIKIKGDKKDNYQLYAHVHDYSSSTFDPQSNYNYNNLSILNFDKKLNVFYSIKCNVYDTLRVSYPNLTYKREIQGNFPKALLGEDEYLFIGGQWFEIYNGTLTKY